MSKVTALIRYKNSAQTLPSVLSAIQRQRHPVDCIVAVDTGSEDNSSSLLSDAGAQIVHWKGAYHHSKVLNYGFAHCDTPYVLCLSSHTIMEDETTVERLLHSMKEPSVVASSICWDDDTYYSNDIDQSEIAEKGVKFGSIYTNSLGLIRRAQWSEYHFDESINGMEDYDWALHQLAAGYSVARISVAISYLRNAHNRDFQYTALAFLLANRYGLKVRWLGRRHSFSGAVRQLPGKLSGNSEAVDVFNLHVRRLGSSLFWRCLNLNIN